MKQRIAWIDIAKGICMISVVLGHFGNEYLNIVYAFHLTTFFILGGYTLKKKELTSGYLTNKFSRLMVPYFVTCVCVTVMDVINAVVQHNVSTINITQILYKDIMRSFFASGTYTSFDNIQVGGMIGAIWFLPAMFFSLIFTQIVLNKLDKWKERYIAGIIIAAIGSFTAPFLWLPFSIQASMLAVPFVLFGMWIKEVKLLEKLNFRHYILFAIIFLIGCLTGYAQVFYMVTCTMKDYILTPTISICACLLVIGISKKIGKLRVLEFVGENSIIFLCVHLFEMNTLSAWFIRLRSLLHLGDSFIVRAGVRMLFIFAVSSAIAFAKNGRSAEKEEKIQSSKRNVALDFVRANLIMLMIVGHRPIDGAFRNMLYSFHMMVFVIISGYFYRTVSKETLRIRCVSLVKSLFLYGVFGIVYILVTRVGWTTELIRVLVGMSYAKNLLTNVGSIGPVYFILMLFVVRIVYVLIDYFVKNELHKNVLICFCAILGVGLGRIGWWLPWSVDCAMFSLVFYHAGYYMKKYNVLDWCKERPYLYFVLSPVFALMVYRGGMELAVRAYSTIGLLFIGVVASFLLLYMACEYISNKLPRTICMVIQWVGESTGYILSVHTLFNGAICYWAEKALKLNVNNVYHLAVTVVLQIILGVVVLGMVKVIRNTVSLLGKRKTSRINNKYHCDNG